MACVTPEGKPTESGRKMLGALKSGVTSPEEVSQTAGLPLFRVRSGLREMVEAGLVEETAKGYQLTDKGAKLTK